jgi:hypothetical protein
VLQYSSMKIYQDVLKALEVQRYAFEIQQKNIEAAMNILRALSGSKAGGPKKRTMSAAARKKIAAAQRKRWRLQKASEKK